MEQEQWVCLAPQAHPCWGLKGQHAELGFPLDSSPVDYAHPQGRQDRVMSTGFRISKRFVFQPLRASHFPTLSISLLFCQKWEHELLQVLEEMTVLESKEAL